MNRTALLRSTYRGLVRGLPCRHQELPMVTRGASVSYISSTSRHLKAPSSKKFQGTVLAGDKDVSKALFQSNEDKEEDLPEAEILAERSEHDEDVSPADSRAEQKGGSTPDAHDHANCQGHSHDHDHVDTKPTDDSQEDEDEDEKLDDSFLRDWYGSTPVEAYQRIIDAARFTAEIAYSRNGAMVGALAEAGGDEGASERWLLGYLTLLQDVLPEWWDSDSSQKHRDALMAVANNRNGDHFMKRCVDPLLLQKRLGKEDFGRLDMVAFEVHMSILNLSKNMDESMGEEGGSSFTCFSDKAINDAKAIWGEETMKQINKKTAEEAEEERQAEGMMHQIEKGNWWGAATDKNPEEAYARLLDATRLGTMMASEKGEYIGAIADAVKSQEGSAAFDGMEDFQDEIEDDEDVTDDHADDTDDDSDDDDESSDDDDENSDDIDKSEEIKEDSHEVEKDADNIDAEADENEEDADNSDAEADEIAEDADNDPEKPENADDVNTTYDPEELGPNAIEHFERFLKAMKETKTLPPWWNDEHEAELWRLGRDKDGDHFLGYPMDKDEMKEAYDTGVRTKISALAEAAADALSDGDEDMDSSMYGKNMTDEDFISKMNADMSNDMGDDLSDDLNEEDESEDIGDHGAEETDDQKPHGK